RRARPVRVLVRISHQLAQVPEAELDVPHRPLDAPGGGGGGAVHGGPAEALAAKEARGLRGEGITLRGVVVGLMTGESQHGFSPGLLQTERIGPNRGWMKREACVIGVGRVCDRCDRARRTGARFPGRAVAQPYQARGGGAFRSIRFSVPATSRLMLGL